MKKELFRLVVLPCLFIRSKEFSCTHTHTPVHEHTQIHTSHDESKLDLHVYNVVCVLLFLLFPLSEVSVNTLLYVGYILIILNTQLIPKYIHVATFINLVLQWLRIIYIIII